MTDSNRLALARATFTALLLGSSSVALAQSAPIVQPGAPGQASKTLSAEEASKLAAASYTPADVAFMQGMIGHHAQAVEMAKLIKDRTNREEIVSIGGRIESSQADEIKFMNSWLSDRGEKTVMAGMMNHAGMDHSKMDHAGMDHGGMDHSGHAMIDHSTMAGMATPEQMATLATLEGEAFDRMFLGVAVATEQLHAVQADSHALVGRQSAGQCRLPGERQTAVRAGGAAPGDQTQPVEFDGDAVHGGAQGRRGAALPFWRRPLL